MKQLLPVLMVFGVFLLSVGAALDKPQKNIKKSDEDAVHVSKH